MSAAHRRASRATSRAKSEGPIQDEGHWSAGAFADDVGGAGDEFDGFDGAVPRDLSPDSHPPRRVRFAPEFGRLAGCGGIAAIHLPRNAPMFRLIEAARSG